MTLLTSKRPWWALVAAVGLLGCPQPGGNTPPTAHINTPVEGAVLQGQGPHLLLGEATDPDEALPDAALQWSSDRDGPLGTGRQLSVTLSPGGHRLTLDATDSRGAAGRAQISITVEAANTEDQPPTAHIETPTGGEFFDEGQAIALKGRGSDVEDGELLGAALSWTSDKDGALGTGNEVSFTGAALGKHRLVLTVTDKRGQSGYAAVEIEVVPPGTNRPPKVSIHNPNNGAQLVVGQPLSLDGSAVDPEDGALSGASLVWSSDQEGALGTGSPRSATLSQGVHQLTLTATDSMNAQASATVTVSVNSANNQPPRVQITTPANNSTVFQGTPVSFTGAATDPEDGALSGAALTWSSDLEGALGNGSPLSVTTLRPGDHRVTLVATDSGGNTGTANVNLKVLPANAAPSVSIASPADGHTVSAGTSISFSGTAVDPEDGALTGSALTWRSNVDGLLGQGSPLATASLTSGLHQVTLTATDSGGRSASASIQVTVKPSQTNLPPVARLTGPNQSPAQQSLTFDGSQSSDPDGTLSQYRFDFGDGSAPVSGTQPTASHTFATPGNYTVKLTVADNLGATGSASLAVSITIPKRVPQVADSSPEGHGRICSLAVSGTTLHVVWHSNRHPTIWYGTWQNGVLTKEPVDMLGFGVGGLADPAVSLVLDSGGTAHVAYGRDGQVFYAVRSGSGWQRQRVDNATFPANNLQDRPPSLALNPQGRPVIAYSYDNGGNDGVAVAERSPSGSWNVVKPTWAVASTVYYVRLRGDLAIDGSGKMFLPVYISASSGASGSYLASWDGSTGQTLLLSGNGMPGISEAASLSWAGNSKLYLLSGTGLFEVQLASTLSQSTARLSYVETSSTAQHAVATDSSGAPRLVINHGSDLEHVQPGAKNFWEREELGDTDSARIDAAVDSAGDTRACFFRASKLVLY